MQRYLFLLLLLGIFGPATAQTNVGIGTNAPQQRLDVNGNARVRGLAAPAGQVQYVQTDQNGDLQPAPCLNFGRVDANSTLSMTSHAGLTITKLGTGHYRVNYPASVYSAIPTINATLIDPPNTCLAATPVGCVAGSTWTGAAPNSGCMTDGSGSRITNFTTTGAIQNVNNNSACNGGALGYGDFTGQYIETTAGASFNVSVTLVRRTGSTSGVNIWVDTNQDGSFDAAESIFNFFSAGGTATYPGVVTIPANVPCGTYRLRIRTCEVQTNSSEGCNGTDQYGEVEDYSIIVNAAANSIPYINIQNAALGSAEIRTFNTLGNAADMPFHFHIMGQ